ncbi:flavohemoglobin expression-modulating QEGLA motif protein [Microbacterium trichothecenolyticum]|uniref:flavohemoglobin expression-modulating QEGLA motif protein n=1 Tax=Microbacterium trichothecenolyticum TaxID=69370 RepID=UPI001C9E9F1A|nr:tyrosine/phenylalanine carboxypeptidase domain-containing protein [Microbacterium trichothecenolyticum]
MTTDPTHVRDAGGPETDVIEKGAFSAADLAADHAMASLAGTVRFLLEMTPVNADDIRARFLAHPEVDPVFEYRTLDVDPDVLDAQVAALPLDAVTDTTLAALLRNRQREMKLRVEMLRARNTSEFLQLSIAQYGPVLPALVETADDLLSRLPHGQLERDSVGAEEFLAAARAEIAHYRSIDPDAELRAEIREDVSGVLVEGSTLLISHNAAVAGARVNALLQHEVGTHLVTHVNGLAQPIHMLGAGLAHYDETQEGLAVLAEIACGGLTASRLRQLAARVVAVHALVGGASFVETHRLLTGHGLPAGSAYSVAMRVYRAGGFTKDAIYLRGLLALLDHVARGGALDLLFLGKFSLEDLPLVQELAERELLAPARIMPRYLSDAESADRLREAARADDLVSLVNA